MGSRCTGDYSLPLTSNCWAEWKKIMELFLFHYVINPFSNCPAVYKCDAQWFSPWDRNHFCTPIHQCTASKISCNNSQSKMQQRLESLIFLDYKKSCCPRYLYLHGVARWELRINLEDWHYLFLAAKEQQVKKKDVFDFRV